MLLQSVLCHVLACGAFPLFQPLCPAFSFADVDTYEKCSDELTHVSYCNTIISDLSWQQLCASIQLQTSLCVFIDDFISGNHCVDDDNFLFALF